MIIPSYKEDSIIVDTAANALEQDYPDYTVTVIADHLQPQTIDRLKALPVHVIQVQWEKA